MKKKCFNVRAADLCSSLSSHRRRKKIHLVAWIVVTTQTLALRQLASSQLLTHLGCHFSGKSPCPTVPSHNRGTSSHSRPLEELFKNRQLRVGHGQSLFCDPLLPYPSPINRDHSHEITWLARSARVSSFFSVLHRSFLWKIIKLFKKCDISVLNSMSGWMVLSHPV